MAVIQFSIPSELYVKLVERAAALGISEHQLAKQLTIIGEPQISDEEIYLHQRAVAGRRAERRTRARPL